MTNPMYPGIENDPQALVENEDLRAVEERRRARAEEYGEWVAIQNIPWGTVLAFTPGMQVPRSTVERLKWDEYGLVAKRTSKAGREVIERTGAFTPEELEQRRAAADKESADSKKSTASTSRGGS